MSLTKDIAPVPHLATQNGPLKYASANSRLSPIPFKNQMLLLRAHCCLNTLGVEGQICDLWLVDLLPHCLPVFHPINNSV